MELLRQRRSVFAASSKYTHYRNGDKAQRDYSALAIKGVNLNVKVLATMEELTMVMIMLRINH
jgi:hypothetical protein